MTPLGFVARVTPAFEQWRCAGCGSSCSRTRTRGGSYRALRRASADLRRWAKRHARELCPARPGARGGTLLNDTGGAP